MQISSSRTERIERSFYEENRELSLRIVINTVCNHSCVFCFRESEGGVASQIPIALALKAASYAAEFGISRVRLTGGEPLLHPQICSIVNDLMRIPRLNIGVTTNGTRLALMSRALYESGLRTINVSLPAVTPSKYHRITQKPDCDIVLQGIESAMELGLFVTVNVPIVADNISEIRPIIEYFCSRPNARVRFFQVLEYRRDYDYVAVSHQEIATAVTQVSHEMVLAPGKVIIRRGREVRGSLCENCTHRDLCRENAFSLRVTCDGFLKPCVLNSSLAVDFTSGQKDSFRLAHARALSIYK